MKNVITCGKLIGLLLFCLPLLLSINVHTKNTRNEIACLVMGTIFLSIQVFFCGKATYTMEKEASLKWRTSKPSQLTPTKLQNTELKKCVVASNNDCNHQADLSFG